MRKSERCGEGYIKIIEVYSKKREVWRIIKDSVWLNRKNRKVDIRMKVEQGEKKDYMNN